MSCVTQTTSVVGERQRPFFGAVFFKEGKNILHP